MGLDTDILAFSRETDLFYDKKHICVVGMTGSGKTNLMESLLTDLWEAKKWKVIGVTLKSEMCMIGFKESDPYLAYMIRHNYGREPRAYPTEVYVPFVRSQFETKKESMTTRQPKHKEEFIAEQKKLVLQGKPGGYCHFKPFKISFSQLSSSDWIGLLQNVTPAGKTALSLLFQSDSFNSIEDLLKKLVRLSANRSDSRGYDLYVGTEGEDFASPVGKPETYTSLTGLVSRLQKTGLIVQDSNKYVLDLDKIMRDTNTITVFDLSGVSKQLAHMTFTAIFSKIVSLRLFGRYPHALFVIPEVHNFAPASSSISPFAVGDFSSLGIMQHLSKEVRLLGATLLCDTQNPIDIDKTFRSNFGWWGLGFCHKDMVKKIHQNIISIPEPALYNIHNLNKGQFCFLPVSYAEYHYPVLACPTLGYHRKAGDDVIDWVYSQPDVIDLAYSDFVPNPLFSRISSRGVFADKGKEEKVNLRKITAANLLKDFWSLRKTGLSLRKIAEKLGCPYNQIQVINSTIDSVIDN